jgi:hypothetical protein
LIRPVAVLGVMGALLVGCVSVNPGASSVASSVPSQGITTPTPATATAIAATATPTTAATPTAAATVPPTNAPTAEPTSRATESSSPLPSAAASPAPVENYGATTPLFSDTFDDPNSGWSTGTNEGGTVAYVDSALQVDTTVQGAWLAPRRLTGSTDNVVHIEALFTPSAPGYQGLLCANADDELWGAVVNADGMYVFIKLGSTGATLLSDDQQEPFQMLPGATTRLSLDCAGTATGGFRMQLSSPGTNIGAQYMGASGEGPESFDRVGIYAESGAHPYTLRVDDLLVFGGTGDTSISPAAEALMQHVPADWQPLCFEGIPSFSDTGAQANITCQLDGGKSDFAEYTVFDTKENMDAAYQTRVDAWVTDTDVQSCDTGPDEGTYPADGPAVGRVLCAPQTTGTRLDWTLDLQLILSTLTDFEGSYADMYADWLVAGPN